MADIIKVQNGEITPQAVNYIIAIEKQMKALKAEYDAFRDELQQAMEQNGILKLESDGLKIAYVGASQKETFDSKKFREDFPDLYNEYVKFSNVKASVRIKAD